MIGFGLVHPICGVPVKSTSLETQSPLDIYYREITRYPLLSPEEEFELAVKYYEQGDKSSAHRLVTSNLRLVVKIANELRRSQVSLLDLIQEGTIGLMQAVKKFNPYKGAKLSTYAAWWIRAYILKYLMDNRGQIRIATTATHRKLYYNLEKEKERLIAENQDPTPKALALRLGVGESDVVEMQRRLAASEVSLDKPVVDDGPVPSDQLADDRQISVEDFLADREIKEIFSEFLDSFRKLLGERDRDILETRILADDPLTLQEIGDRYGISRERVRQVEDQIVRKLRDYVMTQGQFS